MKVVTIRKKKGCHSSHQHQDYGYVITTETTPQHHHQSSIINHQSSIINHQSSIINHYP